MATGRKIFKVLVAAGLLSLLVYGFLVYNTRPTATSTTWFAKSSTSSTQDDSVKLIYDPYADVTDGGGRKPPPGRPFEFSIRYLESVGFPLPDSLFAKEPVPSSLPNDDFAVVTAANSGFMYVDMDAIALVQRNLPRQRIIFYDLGGIEERFVEKIRKLCNVEYRKFNFSRYPPHVAELKTYAWKPIVIHDVLRTYGVVLWIDSSMRLRTNNLTRSFAKAQETGLLLFDFSGHSVFSATHSGLYDYLPIDKQTAGMAGMFGANGIFIFRKRQIYEPVLRWWFLCALTEGCIAPTRKLACSFAQDPLRHWKYGNCHRFDQSALGVLLANNMTRCGREKARRGRFAPPSTPPTTTKTPDPSVDRGADQLMLGSLVVSPDVGKDSVATERGSVDREMFYVCGDRKRSEMTDADLRKPRDYFAAGV